jgi:hypothetical protein
MSIADRFISKKAQQVDPNVPTGVNVIQREDDGRWIVYSDGMDKMLAGPFDTEAEADAEKNKIMNQPEAAAGADTSKLDRALEVNRRLIDNSFREVALHMELGASVSQKAGKSLAQQNFYMHYMRAVQSLHEEFNKYVENVDPQDVNSKKFPYRRKPRLPWQDPNG